ncbi:MAG: Ribonuclease [Elusimicrobia bacterium]|nr:Ribonuclease [Elusimicrobiota bacterium]
MNISLRFSGGADEVTGSRHLLSYGSAQFLLDCGLFQGHRHEAIEKNRSFTFSVSELNAVLLSHAHIDHSGGLPFLVKQGYKNPIHCTRPTVDLCRIMLMDSAFLQEEDAKFFNKIHQSDGQTIEALYTREDAENAIRRFVPHEYGEFFQLGEGLRACFINAGHVLGSAMIQIEMDTPKGKRRLLFTGDLGRRKSILMEPPSIPNPVDYLLIESTYGNRVHESIREAEKILAEIIQQATQEKGRILIPSFALERTQEIVFILEKLRREKRIPPIHIYVDSPMAVNITEIFNRYLDCACLSPEFKTYVDKRGDPFGLDTVRYIRLVEESKALNDLPGQKIIIAGSGMCEGGRILHHLRNNIGKDSTTVILVGFQASGTLGRRLAEGAKKVKIFGLEHEVRARVRQLQNFSSHADKDDLQWFIRSLDPRPKRIFLVHGDEKERQALSEQLALLGIDRVERPRFGDEFQLT